MTEYNPDPVIGVAKCRERKVHGCHNEATGTKPSPSFSIRKRRKGTEGDTLCVSGGSSMYPIRKFDTRATLIVQQVATGLPVTIPTVQIEIIQHQMRRGKPSLTRLYPDNS